MSFLYQEYIFMLESLIESGKQIGGVADFLNASANRSQIILRHDVDRFPKKSYDLARLEFNMGIRSTYYFRINDSGKFPNLSIRKIADFGHEVGYHYEDLSFCRGDFQEAQKRFLRNLEVFRNLAPCLTVSMHGSPLSKYSNLDLLSQEFISQVSLLGDAVSSIERFCPYYLTDTGGKWLSSYNNLRDYVGLPWPSDALPSQKISFRDFVSKSKDLIYISTHPERWNANYGGYLYSKIFDLSVNSAKWVLSLKP